MVIAATVKQYLDNNRFPHQVLDLTPAATLCDAAKQIHIPLQQVARAVLLHDQLGLVMAVIPATHSVDVAALSALLRRRIDLARLHQVDATFRDCASGFIPPLGEAYGMRTIMDDQVIATDDVYFTGGSPSRLFKVSGKTFHAMQRQAWIGNGFTKLTNPQSSYDSVAASDAERLQSFKARIERISELPPMPQMAMKIVALSSNPKASADDLAKVVEQDPSLAAQVLRYANSAFFGYQGKVDSVNAAIARVLGYDMVMNLSLGIAAAKPFRIPQYGPLGLTAFWKHATYSAALTQALARAMPEKLRPRAGLAYLAGLLHNFGHLLLGHKFKQEFMTLNDLIVKYPERPVIELETELLGINHAQLGAWLMDAWGMPEEIAITVREHHNLHYSGQHAVYVQLTQLADRLLKLHGLGDAESSELPPHLLEALQLDEVRILAVVNRILEGCSGLNTMAQHLAA